MLHLLAWIIFLFRETWWDENEKRYDVKYHTDDISLRHDEEQEGKVTEELIHESSIYQGKSTSRSCPKSLIFTDDFDSGITFNSLLW